MYCGQCGKKVMENMLFCPFCGSPIVIPEQDEPSAPASQESKPAAEEVKQVSLFDEPAVPVEEAVEEEAAEDIEQLPFEPLRFSFDEPEPAPEPVSDEKEADDGEVFISLEEAEDDIPIPVVQSEPQPEPKTERRAERKRPDGGRKRENKTYIPVKEVDVDNLFMDEESLEPEDEYDLPDDYDSGFEDEFEFEEPEEGGFFQRHIRGIVGLILMLVVVMIVMIWAFSPKGQVALARMNLAWDAEVYADLGYDAYQQNSDLLAAKYYEKALARDTENYDYAHSAMVAYYEADKIESAASMLKKCVELRPDDPEPYQEMLILYPDAASRPWEIAELVKMGYERTGDASLKLE